MNETVLQGYVFSENKRIVVRYILPILSLISGCFSLWSLISVILCSENYVANIFVFLFFSLLSGFLLWGRKRAMNLLSLKYICENHIIQNYSALGYSLVNTQLPLFLSQTYIKGTNQLPWTEQFYILSNSPIAYVPNHESNGMRIIQTLLKDGVAILPINENTEKAIGQIVNNVKIPYYPKIACLRKNKTGDGYL